MHKFVKIPCIGFFKASDLVLQFTDGFNGKIRQ